MRMQSSSLIQRRVAEGQTLDRTRFAAESCDNPLSIQRAPNILDSGHTGNVCASDSATTRVSSVTIFVEKQTRRQYWRSQAYDTRLWSQSSPTCANYPLLQAGVDNNDNLAIAAKAIKKFLHG